MTLEDVIKAVKAKTGATDARLQLKLSATVWSMTLVHPMGDSVRFTTELVIIDNYTVRIVKAD